MKGLYFLILVCVLVSCEDPTVKNRKELSEVATVINEKCPQMLDSETRLDGIEVKEPNTLVYKYTLMTIVAKNVDTVQFYRALWPGIISNIKASIEMKKLREANTLIEYYYQDKSNTPIYTFHISPADYNSHE
ncbi:hypothetical protein CNR22_08335 [Sphingobacteriaceae bacterium]|nr:hypothetical protein CNR22_08335 [Sphingobacteriaceae bacterium]